MIPFGTISASRRRAAGGGPATIDFLGYAHSTEDGATFTFPAMHLGPAVEGRTIIVGASWAIGNQRPTSITVGGQPVTLDVDAAEVEAVIGRASPSGTTGDVVVSLTGTESNCAVALWSAPTPLTPIDSHASNTMPGVVTLDAGAAVVIGYNRDMDTATPDFRVATEDQGVRKMFYIGARFDGSITITASGYNQSLAAVAYHTA